MFNNQTILVTGGTGSFGKKFVQILLSKYRPKKIIVYSRDELKQFEMQQVFRDTCMRYFIGDVRDEARLCHAMYKADYVVHAAALKQVPAAEYNPMECIKTNVHGAQNVINAAIECGVKKVIALSTDKAANPVNIMGASKRIMEDVIFSYSNHFPVKTARFANVAFSNGSLPLGFLSRIRKLQPLSAPSDVRRYFVSPEESGQICLIACLLGQNREIFFPKLAEAQMMTFDAIGTALLHEFGYEVLECASDEEAIDKSEALKHGSNLYPVHYAVSDTSGEKPFEEFVTETETADMGRFSSLGVITGKEMPEQFKINKLFTSLNAAFIREETTKEEIIGILQDYLPNFNHIETGKSLDNKM